MSTDSNVILMVVIFGIIIILFSVIAAVIVLVRKQKRKMIQLREQGLLGSGVKGEGSVAGVDYYYEHFQGGKNAPPFFKVTVMCSAPGSFKINKETKFDRFFKNLGICVEMDTGDHEFDDAFYITTDTIGFTRQYLDKTDKRRAILDIFQEGFNQVQLDGKRITAIWNQYPHNKYMEEKTVVEIATRLALLSREIPNVYEYEQATMETSQWKLKRVVSFVVPSLVLLFGIVGLIAGLSLFTPLDVGSVFLDSFKYSLPLFILYIWVAVKLLKGHSSSHRELVGVFFLSLFGFIIGGMGGEVLLNGWLDKHPPTEYHAQVIDKYYSKSKNNYSYYAVLESWREGQVTEKISVNRQYYETLIPGKSEMTVTTKPGQLGFPWLVSYK